MGGRGGGGGRICRTSVLKCGKAAVSPNLLSHQVAMSAAV